MSTLFELVSRAARCAVLAAAPVMMMAQPAPLATPAPPTPAPALAPAAPEMYKMMGAGGSFLGVGVQEIDSERSKALKLKEEYGVEVTRVDEDSPALKAGLKAGDVVLEFNGQRVEGTEQFVRLVRETPAGRTVKLLVSRSGGAMTLTPMIATRKAKNWTVFAPGEKMENFSVTMPNWEMAMPDIPKAMMSWRSAVLGVEAESLGESQLAAYFGVKEGVLVRSVMKGTAAEKAGIKAGDVILKVDDAKVTSPRDVTGAIRSARSSARKTLPVVLMREKREMTLTVGVEDESPDKPALPRGQKMSLKQFRMF